MEKIVVTKELSNIRIDKYLADNTSYSRQTIIKMIKDGLVLANDKPVKASYLVKENDVIAWDTIEKESSNLEEANIPLDIVYEDEYLIIVNKQSGLTVHPGAGNHDNTLVNALLYYGKNLSDIGGLERPGVVHRIDKDTSGLIILAKDNKTHEILADNFKNKAIRREYIALAKGVIGPNTGTIEAPIGRDEKNRLKMTVTEKNSKPAITHFKVLKRYQKYTLLSLILDTGRTHQIRVHLNYINHPIYNDPIYTNDETTKFGQFLHSAKMDLIHPITNEKMHFECPLPNEFQEFIDELDKEID
ncbi:MAG: RluA family pseudouridine synthase [Bacilli bacterium]|nr:RluA family pseudouridine synthase [Bacilli bacterium]